MITLNLGKFDPATKIHEPVKRIRGVRRRQSGQSMVEVALIAPLLAALLLGGVELGRYAYISILVENAARAGAAYGSQSLTDASNPTDPTTGTTATVNPGIQTAADNDFQNNGQSSSLLTVTSSTACACDYDGTMTSEDCTTEANASAGACTSGNWVVMVTVTTTGSFQSLIKYPGIPTSLPLTKTVTMRVNQYGG
jgi:Flp pilus assembly protein TadG